MERENLSSKESKSYKSILSQKVILVTAQMLLLKRQMSKQHVELRNPIHTRFVLYYKVDFDCICKACGTEACEYLFKRPRVKDHFKF